MARYYFPGSGACPECKIPLRRGNFRIQLFEDAVVEKEVDIRKRVLKDFNKKEEDFGSLREYNDYLEDVETIIYNLSNSIDLLATNKKIEQYKKDNRELILKNKSKIGREELELEELLEIEKEQDEFRKKEHIKLEQEEKKKKIREKEALIDELMFSNVDAKNIVESFAQNISLAKEEAKQAPVIPMQTQFSTGIKFGRQNNSGFLPVPKEDEGEKFAYVPTTMEMEGPSPPSWADLETCGYINNVRRETDQEKAGGYKANIACLRALQEAFVGLYHVPERTVAFN